MAFKNNKFVRIFFNWDFFSSIIVFSPLFYLIHSKPELFISLYSKHKNHFETILTTNVSVMGAFLGFIVTTLAVLAGILHLEIFKILTKAGKTHELVQCFMRLIYVTSLSLIISTISIFILEDNFKATVLINLFLLYIWLFNFIKCMIYFEVVLKKHLELSVIKSS